MTGNPAAKPSLRERQRLALRAEITAEAMALFLERGFDETTVDDIAARAGVSRSSFFRHFPAKEDVVLGSLAVTGELIRDALEARPADEDAWQALTHAVAVPLRNLVDDPERSLRANVMLADTPSLRARRIQKRLLWEDLLLPDVRIRIGDHGDRGPDARARALVAAALSCVDAAIHEWVAARGQADIYELYRGALSAVRGAPPERDDRR